MSRTVVMERGGARWWRILVVVVVVASPGAGASTQDLPPPCDSEIYCHGNLLRTVQMAKIFNDSKHFVDMPLKNSPEQTLNAFQDLMNDTQDKPTKEQIQNFVTENFNEPGAEFESWTPDDWQSNPEFLKKIVDPALEKWAKDLNELWKKLGRKISSEVLRTPEKFSQIYVPNPVIVPGGRFREFYYWDSYWTIEGLLLSGMTSTVKGMLENFLAMIKTYGMVPNGGRIYYTRRSQPPYLIPMVKLYMDYTNDLEFLRENIDLLEEEFQFWENRTVQVTDRKGKSHKVAQYNVRVGEPRPESYKEDYELAHTLDSEDERQKLYVELKSGAESGWDYSTRWFINNNTNKGTLKDINVTSIAPVDLNSLLCLNARILRQFYKRLGNYTKGRFYGDLANQKNITMAELFWDETDGSWYDFDVNAQMQRRYFYLSNIHPLWSGCYGQEDARAVTVFKVITYLKNKKVIDYIGGVPTSLVNSGQQWDFPNAWAPLQHITILGIYNARNIHHAAESLAFNLAEKWIRTNWMGYKQSTPPAMFEKYNVTIVGLPGGGGEYNVQLGFGWSNGVALQLLDTFGDRLTATTGGAADSHAVSLALVILTSLLPLFRSLQIGSLP